MNFHGQQSYVNTTVLMISWSLQLCWKLNFTDVNEVLLIYSSATRFKTFLTSVTTCTSHHYEN